MVYEIVVQTVDPARRDEFVATFRQAFREANFAGFRGGKMCTSVEDPERVMMVIEWDSVEAHTQHRGTPAHNRFRETTSGYQTKPSEIQHYVIQDL